MRIETIDWDGSDPAALAARLRALVAPAQRTGDQVTAIIGEVAERGDAALRELAERFGEAAPAKPRVDPAALTAALESLEPRLESALRLAGANIEAVARAELETLTRPAAAELPQGQQVEIASAPVTAAGVYAPGGRGAYPSSVLMCCLPARVAGVSRIAVATPPGPGGPPNDVVLAACALAGVDEVYAIGGAQAIAALALGTETVAPVEVIVGPGNPYVTEAKHQLAGVVGIDGLAGPSELVVVADAEADARAIALDLCAQAEHGDDGLLALVSADRALLDRAGELVAELAAQRPSVREGRLELIFAPGIERALAIADAIAPEHLELDFAGAEHGAAHGRVAGCVFVGAGGATAFGDYAAGSNHVLPTGGGARFGGPLGPGAFMRRTSVVSIPEAAARQLAPHVAAIAEAEGFPVHGESATARMDT
jgi:histidinol dehydrogenase